MTENYPTNVALKHGNYNTRTYTRTSDRVNSIASALISPEMSPKSIVGVFQEPGPDWICSMLAIMGVGATYIPLDTSTPLRRLANMARIISTGKISDSSGNKVPIKADSEDATVILYTSETTGTPKGVVLSHRGLRNYLEWENMWGHEIVLRHSALGFDLGPGRHWLLSSMVNLFLIVPRLLRGDSIAVTKLITQEKITCVGATSSEHLGWIQYGFSNLIQDLPLTRNGKLDRAAGGKLPVSTGTERATGAAKLGNVERQLREAWEEVIPEQALQHYTIDQSTNFFHVGGNSSLLITVANETLFQLVQISWLQCYRVQSKLIPGNNLLLSLTPLAMSHLAKHSGSEFPVDLVHGSVGTFKCSFMSARGRTFQYGTSPVAADLAICGIACRSSNTCNFISISTFIKAPKGLGPKFSAQRLSSGNGKSSWEQNNPWEVSFPTCYRRGSWRSIATNPVRCNTVALFHAHELLRDRRIVSLRVAAMPHEFTINGGVKMGHCPGGPAYVASLCFDFSSGRQG
ncbi:polyketide synthase, putative [Metarhizium acridum CQMa 102]|uniref:Polyketide synthase, putative n=1 Tax=Metarhizium acridum (strain CQMa 102) TaxID=655827 RepID=E9DV17_METAQ|nr:polyketide synthase, putative [Metarhizium acridum CQMa 102]EFY92441.1 polyketide synthase, putative [Metarhizium acridum CQMa 102]